MSVGRSIGKRLRANLMEGFWLHPCHPELDVIDRGDHVKVTACSNEIATWWLGRLRAVYPQDHLSGDNQIVKMHPEAGVTLQLNRDDGTLRIKGRKHLQWFERNFRTIVEGGSKELTAMAGMSKVLDRYLRIDDCYTVPALLQHLPPTGALKHGPTYIYRLWRGLLDLWTAIGDDVYIISPLLDARRLADAILILAKHRLVSSRLHVFTMSHCDGESKFTKVFKEAKEMLKDLKGPNKKRLLSDDRLRVTLNRFEAKFGQFHCKMIAFCREGHAEVMVTSASFHKWNFEMESSDTVVHFRMSTQDLINQYLAPLGLEHQVPMEELMSPSQPHRSGPVSSSSQGFSSGGESSSVRPNSYGEDSLRPDSMGSESNS